MTTAVDISLNVGRFAWRGRDWWGRTRRGDSIFHQRWFFHARRDPHFARHRLRYVILQSTPLRRQLWHDPHPCNAFLIGVTRALTNCSMPVSCIVANTCVVHGEDRVIRSGHVHTRHPSCQVLRRLWWMGRCRMRCWWRGWRGPRGIVKHPTHAYLRNFPWCSSTAVE